MSETLKEKMGYVLAVLILVLVFTGTGIIVAPGLAELLEFFLALDLGMLALISVAYGIQAVKEWLGTI